MNISTSKTSCVLMLSMILAGAAVSVQAAGGEGSLFAGKQSFFALQTENSDRFSGKSSFSACNGLASAEPMAAIDKQERSKTAKIIAEIWGGILGNALGSLIGAGVMMAFEGHGSGIIFFGGSALGSALGVYSAGNSENVNARGRFGMTLLGSLLGELAVIGLFKSTDDGISLIPAVLLPVFGAVIGYNISLSSQSLFAGNALLNLNAGKLALGIPDIHIRRMKAKDENAKPAFGFNVRVFSVEL